MLEVLHFEMPSQSPDMPRAVGVLQVQARGDRFLSRERVRERTQAEAQRRSGSCGESERKLGAGELREVRE